MEKNIFHELWNQNVFNIGMALGCVNSLFCVKPEMVTVFFYFILE